MFHIPNHLKPQLCDELQRRVLHPVDVAILDQALEKLNVLYAGDNRLPYWGQIVSMRLAGDTYPAIAKQLSITPGRAQQLYVRVLNYLVRILWTIRAKTTPS